MLKKQKNLTSNIKSYHFNILNNGLFNNTNVDTIFQFEIALFCTIYN